MKYITSTGKIIEGESPLELLVSLKNSSCLDMKMSMSKFMDVFTLRIKLNYGVDIDGRGHAQILDELEMAGFLLRIG